MMDIQKKKLLEQQQLDRLEFNKELLNEGVIGYIENLRSEIKNNVVKDPLGKIYSLSDDGGFVTSSEEEEETAEQEDTTEEDEMKEGIDKMDPKDVFYDKKNIQYQNLSVMQPSIIETNV